MAPCKHGILLVVWLAVAPLALASLEMGTCASALGPELATDVRPGGLGDCLWSLPRWPAPAGAAIGVPPS
eukprot:9122028-Alexandrium_andersonii.AAC.1